MITFASLLPVSPASARSSWWKSRKGRWSAVGLKLKSLCPSGLTADGRILIDKARVECQSHRLTVEDPVSIEYITKHVAGIQQVYPIP